MVIESIGQVGDKKAADAVIEMLEDNDSRVRQVAIRALGRLKSMNSVVPLLQVMSDENLWVKNDAIDVLKAFESQAYPQLLDALNHEEEEVQENCIEVLSQIDDRKLMNRLIHTLSSRFKLMRANAAAVLGLIGDKNSVIPLVQLLEDRDYEVRQKAAIALGKIADLGATMSLKEALKDSNKEVRQSARWSLDKIREKSGVF